MASNIIPIKIDAREAASHITVRVQVKNLWWVRIGVFFIKIGCKLSGAQYVEEFPMSLIQDGEPVELDRLNDQ